MTPRGRRDTDFAMDGTEKQADWKDAEALLEACRRAGCVCATAESCTGGLIGGAITAIPGSSEFYKGGIVSYSNEAKASLLGVRQETLSEHGAVSSECAGEMAAGACKALNADCAVAVTGIAGPGGGTAMKPVGLVFIASIRKGRAPTVTRNVFSGDREEVRRQTVGTALSQLTAEILLAIPDEN